MLRILILCIVYLFPLFAYANCDFKTGKFIAELQDPRNIKNITISVPKSAKWQKNALRILTSRTENIPTKLKKTFRAKFYINYIFGSCVFWGSVKQNGDWRDHILYTDDGVIRSLNATLDQGNVLNSVRFKLLIPSTRGGLNEVFGISVLNSLGFITPETSQINVTVNGISSKMIFQETARKELLERNSRREGPLFEGDESIIWGNNRLLNDNVSLSRLENSNWFLKGKNSQAITLRAFGNLQASYILRGNRAVEMGQYIDPNTFSPSGRSSSMIFPKFHFVIQALAAEHALISHNRKFYYNVFDGMFEPIYYDGNILHNQSPHEASSFDIPFASTILRNAYEELDVESYAALIASDKVKEKSSKYFIKHSGLSVPKAAKLFDVYWSVFAARTIFLQHKIQDGQYTVATNKKTFKRTEFLEEIDIFAERAYRNPLLEALGLQLTKTLEETYLLELQNNKIVTISTKQLAKILEKNSFRGQHFTLLQANESSKIDKILHYKLKGGEIIASKDIKISIDEENRSILFEQKNSNDWALIKDILLENWKINFIGISQGLKKNDEQRFNGFGMTGCLNFFNTIFKKTTINVHKGECEDSLNIVNSKGNLADIKIFNSYSDAIDIDFSNISINKIAVNKAGNDCFDVSGGNYQIFQAALRECGDKGVSVGESSNLTLSELNLIGSNIGISSKDYSKVEVVRAQISNTYSCVEVRQKKQEFGGAYLAIEVLNCNGKIEVDKDSVFKLGKQ